MKLLHYKIFVDKVLLITIHVYVVHNSVQDEV